LTNYIVGRYKSAVPTRRRSREGLIAEDYRLLAEFRRRLRQFLAFSDQQAKGAGLEPQQHQLLLAVKSLALDGAPTVRQLADQLLLRHNSVVELVDRLEERGMVRRTPSPSDGRAVAVQLTPRGAAVLRRLTLVHRSELRETGPALLAALERLFPASTRTWPDLAGAEVSRA
jgi:DNA-binding MarR family transcriptional regulator